MILHLTAKTEWDAAPADQPYAPAAAASDGFIHCTAGDELLLQVANRWYKDRPGEYLVLSIDETKLTAPVKWEPPEPPTPPAPPEAVAEYGSPAAAEPQVAFPHLYGLINRDAITGVRVAVRAADGAFTGFATPGAPEPPAPSAVAMSAMSAPATPATPAEQKAPEQMPADPLNPLNLKSPSQMADELLKATDDFSEALARFKDSVEARIDEIDKDIQSKL